MTKKRCDLGITRRSRACGDIYVKRGVMVGTITGQSVTIHATQIWRAPASTRPRQGSKRATIKRTASAQP